MLQTPEQVESSSERGLYSRLQDKLGASEIRSSDDLVDLVEKRLPASTVKALVHSGLTDLEAFS